MATYYRRDDWVTDALGNAIAGASVYVCSQPATTSTIPPSPLVQLYADPNGVTPLTQPVLTDGYGHAFYYTEQGIYTVLYSSPQIQEVILTDQVIVSPSNIVTGLWNSDSSTAGSITGAINGSNVTFQLSGQPLPVTSLLFAVNGVIQTGYTISGQTVTLATAPHTGNVLSAIYQTGVV
jgi:hypothetical protein